MKNYNKKQIKADIKELSNKQVEFKKQRKTVYLKVKRTIEPNIATSNVTVYKEKLRLMYAAYGLIKGKMFSQIENHYEEENHPLKEFTAEINKISEKYFIKEEALV